MVWTQEVGTGSALALLHDDPPDKAPAPVDEALARALSAYQQVMGLDREKYAAMAAAGLIAREKGDSGAAEWLLRRSLAVAPTVVASNSLGHVLLGRRQWDEAIACYRRSLEIDPSNLTTWPNLLFALDLHPGASWHQRLAERRRFDALHCRPLTDAAAPHDNDADPERVLRVGYVSADFKQHSAAHGFGPVILGAHEDRVEVHLYDVDQSPPNPDDLVAAWFKELPHATWHDVRGYDDASIAAIIRNDRIDILVDLSGYSGGGRPLLFARKPAPVQISGFGYATGLGIAAMDYLIADDVLIPEKHEARYVERPLRLPVFMGYEKAPPWPDVAPPPKLRNGYTTYGYLGRVLKISPQALAAWGEILHRDPAARLLLKGGEYQDAALVRQITDALVALGVDAGRLEFRQGTSRYAHLEAYRDVDVMLDPFPHNGGVTTVEAVLMGVPPITLLGDYVCGRVGASLMTALGFKGAIARTPFEYVNHALSTGAETWTHEDRLALRNRLCGSVLMDTDRYAAAAENAYREAWQVWCAGRRAVPGD